MITPTSFKIELEKNDIMFLSERRLNYMKQYEKHETLLMILMSKDNNELAKFEYNDEIKKIFKTFYQIIKNRDHKINKVEYSFKGYMYQINILSERQNVTLEIKDKNNSYIVKMTLSDIEAILHNIRNYLGFLV